MTPAEAQRVEQARALMVGAALLVALAAKLLGVIGRFADGKVAPGAMTFAQRVAEARPPVVQERPTA